MNYYESTLYLRLERLVHDRERYDGSLTMQGQRLFGNCIRAAAKDCVDAGIGDAVQPIMRKRRQWEQRR